jgi:tRNA dimethylallyltransferase
MQKKLSSVKKLIVILGPTASGKSELAVKLAKKFNGEIISADSRQVYKGLDIGAGKVPRDKNPKSKILNLYHPKFSKKTWKGEQIQNSKSQIQKQPYFYKGIRHYLLDVANPKKTFTVAQYQKLAKKALIDILKRGKIPIICGGTGFYIDALIYDYKLPAVPPQPALRKKLEKLSTGDLFKKLKKLDPRRSKNIDRRNRRRLIRALEIILITKKPIPPLASLQRSASLNEKRCFQVLKIGIKKSPEELKKLIKKRLLRRLKIGMIKEVKNLHKKGLSWKRLDDLGLEYRYISRYLRCLLTKKEIVDLIQKESEKYAKRQMTWFKRNKEIFWVKNYQEAENLTKDF